MTLRLLAARICRTFVESTGDEFRIVQRIKAGELRDVVTSLDERLHLVTSEFVREQMPGTKLLSEEGGAVAVGANDLATGDHLVVDPLDGSNNYVLGLPGYGFMAAHVRSGRVEGSLVVVPEQDVYLLFEGGVFVASQTLRLGVEPPTGTVYYAYPPGMGEAAKLARARLLDAIDGSTSGVHRSGSACIGLANLVTGKHRAFVGHHVRIWDAIAWVPILDALGYETRYRLTPTSLVLVSSLSSELCTTLAGPIERELDVELSLYSPLRQLEVTDA